MPPSRPSVAPRPEGSAVAETTWTEALVPWVDALGRMTANFAAVALVVFFAVLCAAVMFGAKRKQEDRLERFQRERKGGNGWSI